MNRYARHAFAIVSLLALAVSGCASPSALSRVSHSDDRPLVLTTFTVLADMVRSVAGDHVRVESITKPGAEIHGYEPTVSDLKAGVDADVILVNGLGLDEWFTQFTDETGAEHVVLSEGVSTIPIYGGDYDGEINPHAWMSPIAAKTYITNIVGILTRLDPDNGLEFVKNGSRYRDQLDELSNTLRSSLTQLPDSQRAIVTCEGAFSYLAADAGLEEMYLWPVNSDKQSTPKQVARVIDFVQEKKVPAVFCESTVSSQPQQVVAAETGVRFGGTLFVDSLSDERGPVSTYLGLLEHDIQTIITGLTGTAVEIVESER